jgi:chemotaxis protein MotA
LSINTIAGIIVGFACIILSIMKTGNLSDFIDPGSIFIVVGGTLCATFASYSIERLKRLMKAIKVAFGNQDIDLNKDIDNIISIANVARRDGLLALEELTDDMKDPFLKKAIMLVVDGSDPELIQSVLETELDMTKARHAENRTILDSAAAYSPAFGMIGTLIGLINMLKNLSNMDSLGSNMSVALVTTFYGSMMANLIFNPLSKRLKTLGDKEYLQKELVIEGVLSIQNGENPRIIKEKLNSFLSKQGISESGKPARGEEKPKAAEAAK